MQIKILVPYEHLHSDFQMLQKEQAKMRVVEPSVPPERDDPQAEKETKGHNKMVWIKIAQELQEKHIAIWIG